jgi:hypothetical protein
MSSHEVITPVQQMAGPEWEYLRQQLIQVRWPTAAVSPHCAFSTVHGVSIGLRMAGAISLEAQGRIFALLCNARGHRLAEACRDQHGYDPVVSW